MATNKSNKKKVAKKVKGKKLEERIAPGMIGGGLGVDPGMVDVPDEPMDSGDSGAGQGAETQVDQVSVESDAPADATMTVEQVDTPTDTYDPGPETGSEAPGYEGNEFAEFSGPEAPIETNSMNWNEADWVETSPDGGMQMTPPEGVQIDDGAMQMDHTVANEVLPYPEEVQLNADGSADIQLPEGTQVSPDGAFLTMPGDTVPIDTVPEQMQAFETPDGNVHVPLPETGMEFNPDSGSLHLDNYHVNEFTPENMEIGTDGQVSIDLPPDAEIADGTVTMGPEGQAYMENPPPDYMIEQDWAEMQPNGSIQFEPPEGVEVSGDVVSIPHDVMTDMDAFPDEMNLGPDGSVSMDLPEGTDFDPDSNSLIFPEGSISLQEVPEGIDAHPGPDGNIQVMLPEGIDYDSETGTVVANNDWANQLSPDNMQINTDGSVDFALPEGAEVTPEGSVIIPPEQVEFIGEDRPDFVDDVDWGQATADGNYEFHPPEGCEVSPEQGMMEFPNEMVAEHLELPEEMTIHPDGSMGIQVPDTASYNADANSITLPEGELNPSELPDGISSHINPDGGTTVYLPEGMDYNADTGSVHMNNYWANAVTPDPVEIGPNGEVLVDLPSDTEFHSDGSFTVSGDHADFLQNPEPPYVSQGPDWIEGNPDGSFNCQCPEGYNLNPEAGTMSFNPEMIQEDFNHMVPDDMQFHGDGSITVPAPEGAIYNPDYNSLTMPAGEMPLHEVPEGIDAMVNPDGTTTIVLPEGMEYQDGMVNMNNHWANEISPDPVHIGPDGNIDVQLPPDTYYHGDGFTVPEHQADFYNNPYPDYASADYVQPNYDGSMNFNGVDYNPEGGYATFPPDAHQHFDYGPGMEFDGQGHAHMPMPEGHNYDPHQHMVSYPMEGPDGPYNDPYQFQHPENFQPHYEGGQGHFHLPPDVGYQDGNVQFGHDAYNHYCAPDGVQMNPDGSFQQQLPSNTYYGESGFNVDSHHADFGEQYQPDYSHDGPDWAQDNPDGSVTAYVPEGVEINPEAGTVSFPHDLALTEFPIPEDVQLNPDGTMDMKLPEGTSYSEGVLSFPPGQVHYEDFPAGMEMEIDANGTYHVQVPQGMEVSENFDSIHMDNGWANEFAPGPIEIGTDGSLTVDLPDGTDFHGQDGFTIPAEQTDFLDHDKGHDQMQADYMHYQGDGSYHCHCPEGFQVDPNQGQVQVPHEHFEELPHDEGFQLNPDGTATVTLPEGTSFDAGSSTLTLPPTESIHDVPSELNPEQHQDGTISVQLPEGIDYNQDGTLNLSNQWVNDLSPEHVEFDNNGSCTVQMPPDTTYYPNGDMAIHSPEYFAEQPTIQTHMPDGSVAEFNPVDNTYGEIEQDQEQDQGPQSQAA